MTEIETQDQLFVNTIVDLVTNNRDWRIDEIKDEMVKNGWDLAYVDYHARAIAEAIYKRDLLVLDGRM